MIQPTTFEGAKSVLALYPGDEYCIVYGLLAPLQSSYTASQRYWLVSAYDILSCMSHNIIETGRVIVYDGDFGYYDEHHFESPVLIGYIPPDIFNQLTSAGLVEIQIPDKEWRVQKALGTAPEYRMYTIMGEVLCET